MDTQNSIIQADNESMAEESISNPPTLNNTSSTVYRTPTGKRFHLDAECGGKNSYEITIEEATASGLTPCSKCAK